MFVIDCPMRALGHNATLIRSLISALYILFACLYPVLPHLSFFLHFFLIYLLPYLSFPLTIDPLHYQAGCRKRRLNVAVFFVFIFFSLVNVCICCVRFSYFPYQANRLAWGNVSEMTHFVSSGT